MQQHEMIRRPTVCLVLMSFFLAVAGPAPLSSQEAPCVYNRQSPSLANARNTLNTLDYRCAENEIADYLTLPSISAKNRADAHFLLGYVYYIQNPEYSEPVVQEFSKIYRSDTQWDESSAAGTLSVPLNPTLRELLRKAQEQTPPVLRDTVTTVPVTLPKKGGSWYTKWWAIAGGGGLIAGSVVLARGGGNCGVGPSNDTIPYFPTTPH